MGLLQELKQDVSTHGAYFGVSSWHILRYASIKIMISFRIRKAFPVTDSLLMSLERIFWGIEISRHANLGSVIFLHPVGVVIGSGVSVGDRTVFNGSNTLGSRYRPRTRELSGGPKLGKNVELGSGAKVLGSISVGNNVLIGANAVVITPLPSNCIAVGVPAKHKPL